MAAKQRGIMANSLTLKNKYKTSYYDGLFGSSGALPFHITEYLMDEFPEDIIQFLNSCTRKISSMRKMELDHHLLRLLCPKSIKKEYKVYNNSCFLGKERMGFHILGKYIIIATNISNKKIRMKCLKQQDSKF